MEIEVEAEVLIEEGTVEPEAKAGVEEEGVGKVKVEAETGLVD